MADNVSLPASAGKAASREVSYSGETAQLQAICVATVAGADDAKTATDVSSTNPLPVNQNQVGGTNVDAFPAGFQFVTDEPTQLFYDAFDSLDTTNRWFTATASGGGVAAAVSAGAATLGSGTTANGYSYFTSRATFIPTAPAWVGASFVVKIESAVGNNAVRFWGIGIVGGTPSSTNPLGTTGNGFGFELDTSGVLQAVVYSNGTRNVVASLASLQPADANYHRYVVYFRTDRIYWFIDGQGPAQLGATASFVFPQVQTLQVLMLAVAHSSAPAASRIIDCTEVAVFNTGKQNVWISDPTYPWRRASVNTSNALSVTISATAAAIAKAEDVASVNADVGVPAMAIRQAAPANTSDNEGDYEMLRIAAGRLWVSGDNTSGDVAHGSADSGNPLKIGGVARTANPTAVADGQRVNVMCDKVGRQVVSLGQARELTGNQVTTIATNTETTVVNAAGAGVYADLTALVITNSSSAAVTLYLRDATGGTTRGIYDLSAFGGIVISFPTPKTQSSPNNNWTLTPSVAVSSINVTAEYVLNV